MSQARIYLPATGADLRVLIGGGALKTAGRTVFGVAPQLAAARTDEEEAEYAAFTEAVDAAIEEAMAGPGGSRVVILAADVADGDLRFGTEGARAGLGADLHLRQVVSAHVGEDEDPESDLLWYDVTELESVAALLGVGAMGGLA